MRKSKRPNSLSGGEKFGYLLANIGNIPLMTLLSGYFLLFYTDIVGLDPAALATLFLISKVMDGVSDPIMGYLLDKFPVTKMGKFRPMLILGTIVCVINYVLLWFGAVWSPVGKYVIVYITYLLLGWTFDIMDISLNSILPVMTADIKERNSLSLIKMVGYMGGMLVLGVVAPIIVAEATLESYYVLIFGTVIITLVCSIVGALGVRERVPFKGGKEEKYGFRDLIKFLTAKPVLVFFLSVVISTIGTQAASGAGTFFYTYIMGDLTIASGVTAVSMLGMLPGMFLSPLFANKMGKKKLYVVGGAISTALIVVRLFAPTSVTMMYVVGVIGSFVGGLTSPLLYGFLADNTMYIQYKTGKRAEAAIASLGSFITKLGQGIAGALPGYVLAATGFVKGADVQSTTVNNGILFCVLGLPIITGVISLLVFHFGYDITQKDVDTMAAAISSENQNVNE